MNWKRLATLTEPARVRAIVAAVIALAAALGIVLPFDLPGIAEAGIALLAVLIPVIQGEATRAAVFSPATAEAQFNTAFNAGSGDLPVTKHEVTPQTPGVADHAAGEE